MLAIKPKSKIVEDQKSCVDTSLHEDLALFRREAVRSKAFEQFMSLEDHDIESAACGLMTYRMGDMGFADSRRTCKDKVAVLVDKPA